MMRRAQMPDHENGMSKKQGYRKTARTGRQFFWPSLYYIPYNDTREVRTRGREAIHPGLRPGRFQERLRKPQTRKEEL
jgi:hypothetical protein